ncbi:MAG: TadE/TadG family type IV pilus assembly protein [Mycobacteriales bacterium]|nr:MAG: hypothetical protein DLM56_00550 [Pseudonocardiales bacterium]
MKWRRRHRPAGDRGAFALEFAIIAPFIALIIAVIISYGEVESSQSQIEDAARSSARMLTSQNVTDPGVARALAQTALTDATSEDSNLTGCGVSNVVRVAIGANNAGAMQVTVRCSTSTMLGIDWTKSATATSPLDPYRATP